MADRVTSSVQSSLVFVAGLLSILTASAVQAETVNCTAITAPSTISSAGIYCLTANVVLLSNYAGTSAISINTGDVVLDLNGHLIDGTALGTGTLARGIVTDVGHKNITIRNGTIRGFLVGISIGDETSASQGNLVENIVTDGGLQKGIVVMGRGSIIQNNQVVNTGGSSVAGGQTVGVQGNGPGVRILNNDIARVAPVITPGGDAITEGIRLGTLANGTYTTDALVVNNRISDSLYGIRYFNGGSGKYRDNLTSSVTTPYSGGTDAGNNN